VQKRCFFYFCKQCPIPLSLLVCHLRMLPR